ncbi:MAG: glycosyltransferase family 2 protein [Stagnimonas sp.]|nr:glycosyltransferase family 2 protein [Stagnimonas sp.]
MAELAPRISVVLPTHNRAATLERAVHSVLDQSFADIELIVVDDGSTDGSVEALAKTIVDPRLRCLRNPASGGPGAARNLGIAQARADWIAFQDSDDLWLPHKLQRQWQAHLQHPSWDLVACDVQAHLLDGTPLKRRPNDFEQLAAKPSEVLLRPLRFPTPTWLVRRSALAAIGGFDEQMVSAEDWDVCLRLADRGAMGGVNDCLVHKFESPHSVYGSPGRRHHGTLQIFQRHPRRWQNPAGREARHHIAVINARIMMLQGQKAYALRWLLEALRVRPLDPGALMLGLSLISGKRLDLAWQRLRTRPR